MGIGQFQKSNWVSAKCDSDEDRQRFYCSSGPERSSLVISTGQPFEMEWTNERQAEWAIIYVFGISPHGDLCRRIVFLLSVVATQNRRSKSSVGVGVCAWPTCEESVNSVIRKTLESGCHQSTKAGHSRVRFFLRLHRSFVCLLRTA